MAERPLRWGSKSTDLFVHGWFEDGFVSVVDSGHV